MNLIARSTTSLSSFPETFQPLILNPPHCTSKSPRDISNFPKSPARMLSQRPFEWESRNKNTSSAPSQLKFDG